MIDRGQLDLEQLTRRLLASRNRPKRQWLIEQIGHIWSLPAPCCLIHPGMCPERPRAAPTPESIRAVQSFAEDPHANVRIAVVVALRRAVPDASAVETLVAKVRDTHPAVRCTAARALAMCVPPVELDDETIDYALENETWTVRWLIAAGLGGSKRADRGWESLRRSIPRADFHLSEWLQCCRPYADRFGADVPLQSAVRDRLSRMEPGAWLTQSTTSEFQELMAGHV